MSGFEMARSALARHFVMWHELDDRDDPPGEWRCRCGAKFGFSTSAIDHLAAKVIAALVSGGAA